MKKIKEFDKTTILGKGRLSVDQIQRHHSWSTPGYAYGVTSQNRSSGITMADYFVIEVHTRFEKSTELSDESNNSTHIQVIVDIKWEKSASLLKSKIETETISGMKKYYEIFEEEINSEKNAIAGDFINQSIYKIILFFFREKKNYAIILLKAIVHKR